MLVLLSKILLGVGLVGIVSIVLRKIPVMADLPEVTAPALSTAFKRRARLIAPDWSGFSFEVFLQKSLSKIKIFVLRMEHKINDRLRRIRRKKKENKRDLGDDEYWNELEKEVEEESD